MKNVKNFFSWVGGRIQLFVIWGKNNPGSVLQIGLVLYYALYTGSWAQAGWELGDLAIQVIGRMYGL